MFYFTLLEMETSLDEMQIEQKLDAICKSKFNSDYVFDWLANPTGWTLSVVETNDFKGNDIDFVNEDKIEVKINFNQGNHKSLLQFHIKLSPAFIVIWTVLISFFVISLYQKGNGFLILFLLSLPIFIYSFRHVSMFNHLKKLIKLHFDK